MQAHPLSSTAARNLTPSGSPNAISEGPGLAHDAGNLLGALGLYCDLLHLPGVLRPEHLHYARELRLLSQRSGALINRLLEVDRAAPEPLAGRPPRRRCPAAVVRAFAPLLRSLAAPDATVVITVAPGLPVMPFAAELLERILVNLIRNAATALRGHAPIDAYGNPDAGQIQIGISGDATHLKLTVMDNGPGMPATVAAAFLEPMPLVRGALSGLGHHIIHDLVHSTGGALSITTIPDRGTMLQIDWPIFPVKSRSKMNAPGLMANAHSSRTLELLPSFSQGRQRKGSKLTC